MTKVNAYQIVESLEWMQHTFGEDRPNTALVVSKDGKKKAVHSIDDESWKVGDWVILWPSRHKTICEPDFFEKNFVHLGGICYETKLS